nr:uncharacterized protein LOC105323934 isoform X3 [Crassostrea gigas]
MHLVNVGCFFYVIFQCMVCAIFFECNSDNHKTFECCPDYYKVNGNCTECPAGTFGLNCSSICPMNFYGQFCQKRCFCRHQYCQPVDGCNINNFTTDGDNFPCIQNYYILDGNCTECPAGTFGLNCSSICPKNFYGQFCQKECFCRHQYCHPVDGCNINNFTTDGDNFPCIQNYYILDGNCTECPDGTFGVNCSQTCPNNYFGRLCKIPCNCSDGQFCDQVKGCIPNNNDTDNGKISDSGLTTVATEVTTDATEITTIDSGITKAIHQRTSKWKDVSFALIGAVFVVLVVAGVFYLRSRLRRFKKHWSFSNTEEDHGNASCNFNYFVKHYFQRKQLMQLYLMLMQSLLISVAEQNIEVANIVSPTHSTQGHASEQRGEALSNVYDDLRLSQMMDRNTVSGTDCNHFAACSEETLNEETFGTYNKSVSKRHYIYSYTETSGEEESANNYEHFRMPTEYSILSLKRNIDPSVIQLYGQREKGNDGAYDVIVGQFHNVGEQSENSQSESESETGLPLTDIQD